MKPGPARVTSRKTGSLFRRSAIFSAMARGWVFAALAAASAPLHWYCARSGRFETVTLPKAGSRPSAVKARPTISESRLDSEDMMDRFGKRGLGAGEGRRRSWQSPPFGELE